MSENITIPNEVYERVNCLTLHAFGVLRVGLVRGLGLGPIRVGGDLYSTHSWLSSKPPLRPQT